VEDVPVAAAAPPRVAPVVPADGERVAGAVPREVPGDALVLQQEQEEVAEDEPDLRVGVEPLHRLVADGEAEEGLEEAEDVLDVPVALVHHPGEEEEHRPLLEAQRAGPTRVHGMTQQLCPKVIRVYIAISYNVIKFKNSW